MKRLPELVQIFLTSILAGVLIGIGVFSNLCINNLGFTDSGKAFYGALIFSVALCTIIGLKLWLFTGKIGYAPTNSPSYLISLLVCYIGNAIGACGLGFFGYLMAKAVPMNSNYRINSALLEKTFESVRDGKLASPSLLAVLFCGIMCGVLIYFAVEIHKHDTSPVLKLFVTVFCVIAFIICGFEHCVADMALLTFSGYWAVSFENFLESIGFLAIVSIGNAIGSIVVHMGLVAAAKMKKD